MDLSELFERMGFRASQRRLAGSVNVPIHRQDVETIAMLTIDEVCHGTQVTLERAEGNGRIRCRRV